MKIRILNHKVDKYN